MDGVSALWRVARTLRSPRRRGKSPPTMLFFTDPDRTPHPETIIGRLPAGAAVVFRAFGRADVEARGEALARLARRRGVRFVVGADAGLARRLKADGVHLPQRAAHRAGEIRALRSRFWVTAAAHDLPAALKAARAGVDAIILSPVFPSASPSAGRAIGPRRLAGLVRAAGAPAYALGGVNAATVRALRRTGVAGMAAIEGFSPRPEGRSTFKT